MLKEIRERLRAPQEHIDIRPVEERLEPALVALARFGLPEQPTELAVHAVRWGGAPAPDVNTIAVEEDGMLQLEAQPPCPAALVPNPANWKPTCFEAEVVEHGPLIVEMGASSAMRFTYGSKGSEVAALLEGWKWKADVSRPADLWAARLKFMTSKPPMVLWWPTGNLLLAVEDQLVRGWRFGTQHGSVFLLPNGDHWYIALEASDNNGPDAQFSHLIRSLCGFVFGEPLNVGIFRRVTGDGVQPGLVHLGLMQHGLSRTNRQAPALPLGCGSTFHTQLVEGLIRLAEDEPDAPVLEAVHLYFAALEGFVESKFLHAWVGLETVARWGMEVNRIPDGGQIRLADHSAWLAWVRTHRAEIEALAAPGMAQSLVDRVLSAEIDRPTRVQRAFRGLGIPWTGEMDDAERTRHGVAHEGTMPGAARDWDRDLARVGLVHTMLTALFAKLVGYDGPIADRSKTCFKIAGKDEPAWWLARQVDREIDYRGQGIDRVMAATLANLDRLEAEGHFSDDTDSP